MHEYTPSSEINRLCAMLEEFEGMPLYDAVSRVQGYWFISVDELLAHQKDIICYSDYSDMTDVTRYLIEETGTLGEVPPNLQLYIDYEAYRRNLEINGSFLVISHGVLEYLK